MGLLSTLRLVDSIDATGDLAMPEIITAGFTEPSPAYVSNVWSLLGVSTNATRNEAMSVPAVARARNIICGTIASLPIHLYGTNTGQKLTTPVMLYQPDPASPKAVTLAWLADSLLFYGRGYLQILETYAEDNRPRAARWIDPNRVTTTTDLSGTLVTGYAVDGAAVPNQGRGSLIAFQGLDEGLLARAGRTIRTAVELEAAAYRAAQEPTPQVALKNTGVDLPAAKVLELLTGWKKARQERATAYVGNLDIQPLSFDPKAQQLVEARQFMASEIARAVGIPAWYLNAEAASMTYTNVTSERRALVDFSLRPIMKAIEDRLSMEDVSVRNSEVRFDLDDFLRGNPLERIDVITKLLAANVIDIDEARAMEDLAPRGDTP